MDSADAITARLAAGQNGILTIRQARLAGLTDKQVAYRQQNGQLVAVHVGVYRHPAVAATWLSRLTADVAAAGPDAVASHRSAATLHGLDVARTTRSELTVPATDLPQRPGPRIHRTNRLDEADITIVSRVPVTTIPRTLLDLGAVRPYEVVEQATQDAIIRGLVQVPALVAVLERVGGRGRRGTASLRAVLRGSVPDQRLESLLEQHLLSLLEASELEHPELQYELRCEDGRKVRLDFAWPHRRLAVEADGHRWHATSRQLQSDLARSRSIQASGWAHHRFGWSDVHERANATLHELCRLAAINWVRVDKERNGGQSSPGSARVL
jgi:very-short-patch-repair endonuclease